MWSSDVEGGHVDAYIKWANLKERDLYKPRMDQDGKVITDQQGQVVYDHSKGKKSPEFCPESHFFLEIPGGTHVFPVFHVEFFRTAK